MTETAGAADLTATALRRLILVESKRAGVGHIGSALSIVEIMVALFRVMRRDGPDRDRFLLGKGHAALALYGALHLSGRLSRHALSSFCADSSRLGVHPQHSLRDVDFSTGSLGHALPIAVGAALAARLDESERLVYVLLSDAECQEGSVWEAALFAGHQALDRMVAVVDVNRQQALRYTPEQDDFPLQNRWRAFGWDARMVVGHDVDALVEALSARSQRPRAVLAATTFGRGVSFMEGQIPWHYLPMNDEEYTLALEEMKG